MKLQDVRAAISGGVSGLGLDAVRRLGAVIVGDADARLCGVVTADQLRRALAAAAPQA